MLKGVLATAFLFKLAHQLNIVKVVPRSSANVPIDNQYCDQTCNFCFTGTNSWYTSSVGYSLSKIEIWVPDSGPSYYGLQLTYSASGQADIVGPLQGYMTGGLPATKYTHLITKKITKVTVHQPSTRYNSSGFTLQFADSTTMEVGQIDASDLKFSSTFNGNLVGFDCQFHTKHTSGNDNRSEGCNLFVDFCIVTTITSRTISDITIEYGTSQTINISFADSAGSTNSNAGLCPKTYILSPSLGFITLTQTDSSAQIALNPTSLDVGEHTMTLNVKVTDYPLIALERTFKITVTCTVSTISITGPNTSTLTLGVDSQPHQVSFSYTKNKACPEQIPTMSLSPNNLAFLSTSVLANSVLIIANGVTTQNEGQYTLTITINVGAVSTIKTCVLDIIDLCKSASIISTPSSLATMVVNAPSNSNVTQTLIFTTNVTQTRPSVVCALNATLSPLPAYISLSNDMNTIIVDPTKIQLPTEIGSHSFTVTITSVTYPATVVQKVLSFDVKIVCTVNSISAIQKPVDAIYVLNQGIYQTAALTLEQQSVCQFPYSYASSYTFQGVLIAKPSWIAFDNTTRKYSMTITQPTDVGVYIIKTTAEIAQADPATTLNRVHFETFTMTVKSDCINTVLIDAALNAMTVKVYQAMETQSLDIFQDTIANSHSAPTYCGQRSFSLIPSHQFLQVSNKLLVLQSQSAEDEGIYQIQVVIGLADYPEVATIQKQIQVTVICEIVSMSFGVKPDAFITQNIIVDPLIVQHFSLIPSPACKNLVYALSPTFAFAVLDTPAKTVSIKSINQKDHGVYTFTLTANPNGTTIGISASTKFDLNLVDLCTVATFYKQDIANFEVVRQSPDYYQTNQIEFKQFQYFPLVTHQLDCGLIKHELFLHKTKDQPPNWIQLAQSSIAVSSKTIEKPIKVQLDLVVSLESYDYRFLITPFNVTLSDSQIRCLPSQDATYRLGQNQLITGPSYLNETYVSQIILTSVSQPHILDDKGGEIGLQPFIKYSQEARKFAVSAYTESSLGFYQLGLKLGYKEFPDSIVTCLQQLNVIYEPIFNGADLMDQTIVFGQKWNYKLPQFLDFFNKDAQVELELGLADKFLQFEKGLLALSVSPYSEILVESAGSHEAKVKLTDHMGFQETRSFKIIVVLLPQKAFQFSLPPPKPYIVSHNRHGKLRVGFTRPIVLPTFERFPEFNDDQYFQRNCTNGGECMNRRNLQAMKIDEENQAIEIVNYGLVYANKTMHSLVKLEIIPGLDSDQNLLNFTWRLIDFDPSYMDFQLKYQHADEISSKEFKEQIQVHFIGSRYFAADDGQKLAGDQLVLQKMLPLQIEPELAALIKSAALVVQGVSKAVMIGAFVQNLFLGGFLSQLFSSIKKLQIMVHLLLTRVQIPVHAMLYFSGLLSLVTYDLINTEPFLRKWLKLEEKEEDFNLAFQSLGYSSVFFVINIGSLFVVMLYLLLKILLIAVTKYFPYDKVQRFRLRIKREIMWNQLLTLLNESLIVFSLSYFLQLQNLSFSSFGRGFSSILANVLGIIIIAFPFISLGLLIRNRDRLQTSLVKNRFGQLYENLNYKRNPSKAVLMDPFFSSSREILMMATMVFLKHPFLQIFINNGLMTFMVIYSQMCEVYKDRTFNKFQLFNEVFVCLLNYHVLLYADLIKHKSQLKIAGWSAIVTVTVNLIANFTYILFNAASDSYKKLRTKYYVRKRRRLIDRIKKKLDQMDVVRKQAQLDQSRIMLVQEARRDRFQIDSDPSEQPSDINLLSNPVNISKNQAQPISLHSVDEMDSVFCIKEIKQPYIMRDQEELKQQIQSDTNLIEDRAFDIKKHLVTTNLVPLKNKQVDQRQDFNYDDIPIGLRSISTNQVSLKTRPQTYQQSAIKIGVNPTPQAVQRLRPRIDLEDIIEEKSKPSNADVFKERDIDQFPDRLPIGMQEIQTRMKNTSLFQQQARIQVRESLERNVRIEQRNKAIQRDFSSASDTKQMFDSLWQDYQRSKRS